MKKHFKNWNLKLSSLDYFIIFLTILMLSYNIVSSLFFNKSFNFGLSAITIVLASQIRSKVSQSTTNI